MGSSKRQIVWNVVFLFFGVIGVLVAIWTYYNSRKERVLTYAVSPERPLIVNSRQSGTDNLGVTYKGQAVKDKDVSSVVVYTWNRGRESIRRENVLSPVMLRLGKDAAVLDARVIRATRRQVTLFEDPEWETGSDAVYLDWRILEAGDGAALQVIFAGSPDSSLRLDGQIEGQRALAKVSVPSQSDINEYRRFRIACLVMILTGICLIAFNIYMERNSIKSFRFKEILGPVSMIALVTVLLIYRFLVSRSSVPTGLTP